MAASWTAGGGHGEISLSLLPPALGLQLWGAAPQAEALPWARAGYQLLLFLNSPFSVICNLVGLVGERPLRVCMLYLSLS